jgi:hypothetical protein
MQNKKKLVIALALLPLYGLIQLLGKFPEFIETYYSNGIYPIISTCLRFSFGWLPFSFGDIFYCLSIIFLIRWIILNFKRSYKDTKNWLLDILCAVTIIYFTFHLFWAFNYYRKPLHENLNLKAGYTTEELITTTKYLISQSNKVHNVLVKNDSVIVIFPYSKSDIIINTPKGYEILAKKQPHLNYDLVSLKKSLLSYPLTIMGFSGYLNPLTNEAQVNSCIPIYKSPTTCAHEIAHQLGYAAENEANFIGFLASINNPDPYFKYSGYTFALRHCLGEIYKRDPKTYETLLYTVNKGILKNYQEVRDFWVSHKNISEPVFRETYNSYLKANNQAKGMESYSYVVALYVNYLNNAN